MIGKTLGHYRVGEQLGRGGMGEVYVAYDLNSNRVALNGTGGRGGAQKCYKDSEGKVLPYRIFVLSNYTAEESYPLVVWLHGSGGRGADNLKQITGGNALGHYQITSQLGERGMG